jgi:hypothetical protein
MSAIRHESPKPSATVDPWSEKPSNTVQVTVTETMTITARMIVSRGVSSISAES